MKKTKILIRVLIVLWLAVIWGHSMQPAVVSEGESGTILAIISKVFPVLANSEKGMFIVRKTAHFTEYFILGTLICIDLSSVFYGILSRFTIPTLVGLLVAFIDETIQLFVVGRSGEIRDMWIDFGGVALGVLVVLAIVNNKKRGRKRY